MAVAKFFQRGLRTIDLLQLERNFQLLLADKPAGLKFTTVVKSKGCGMGLLPMAELGKKYQTLSIAIASIEEALQLNSLNHPLLIFGERSNAELAICAEQGWQIQVQSLSQAQTYAKLCKKHQKKAVVHLKVDTGLGRYGCAWQGAAAIYTDALEIDNLKVLGLMTHFASSDEWSKTHAYTQWERFQQVIDSIKGRKLPLPLLHCCNSGGYLDLPWFHQDLCRLGIVLTGSYPSKVCRRIVIGGESLKSPLRIVSRLAFIKDLNPGDTVGYGMHYTAHEKTKVGVIPIGYGDGYPRIRNRGQVLIHGKLAPIIGGVGMDNFMVQLDNHQSAEIDDEVVLVGEQKNENGQSFNISANDLADYAQTVVYQILVAWQDRLPLSYTHTHK